MALHYYLILPQRPISTILTLKQHAPALQAFQRMPPVSFYIQHSQIPVGIKGNPIRLIAILIKENPTDLSSKDYYSFWATMMPMNRRHRLRLQGREGCFLELRCPVGRTVLQSSK